MGIGVAEEEKEIEATNVPEARAIAGTIAEGTDTVVPGFIIHLQQAAAVIETIVQTNERTRGHILYPFPWLLM